MIIDWGECPILRPERYQTKLPGPLPGNFSTGAQMHEPTELWTIFRLGPGPVADREDQSVPGYLKRNRHLFNAINEIGAQPVYLSCEAGVTNLAHYFFKDYP